jgi:cytochrome c
MTTMRKSLALIGVAGCLLSAGSAFASEELFKRSNCMACHAIDQKRLGPSMKDVAAKYKGDATAADMLAKKIRAGGSGNWGEMPMPPQTQVSEADAKILVDYILGLQ